MARCSGTHSFPLRFSNNLLFFLILHKYEYNFHNSRIMEFVRLIRARYIGLWWGAHIWVFSFDCQLLCLMSIVWSLSCSLICMWWFYTWVNPIFMIAHYYLLSRYTSTPTLLTFTCDSFYYLIISLVLISLSIVTLVWLYLVETHF